MTRETRRLLFGLVAPIMVSTSLIGWVSRADAPFYWAILAAAAGMLWALAVRLWLGPAFGAGSREGPDQP